MTASHQPYPDGVHGGQFGDHNVQNNYFFAHATSPASWLVTVGLPPSRAAAFQERHRERSAIEQALSGGETAVVTLVVSGDGGTGKTQLAAAIHSRALDADLRVWVSATSREAILAAYAQVADIVQAFHAGEKDARAMAFLEWLTTTEKSWLVVLDDVADPGDLKGLWPTGRAGRVLVTTRRRDAAIAGRGRVIAVDVFDPGESLAYLRDRLDGLAGGPIEVLDQASELAAAVACGSAAFSRARWSAYLT